MEAVKMQNTVQVKTRTTRATAAESAAQNDGFVKLLQEKRDLAEPKKADTGKTQDKADQEQEVKDSVPEKTEVKTDKPEESEDEKVVVEDGLEEAVLLQTMIQQAAAQITVIIPEVQQPAEEAAVVQAVEVTSDDRTVPAESLSEEGQIPIMEPVQQQKTESAAQPVSRQTEDKGQDTSPKEENQSQGDVHIRQNVSDDRKRVDNEPEAPPVQTVKNSQPAVQEDKKMQPEEETVQQPLYSAGSVNERTQQVPAEQNVERIPLKTTEPELPQDLGKTLAARLPGSNGELTVELEPASLGKLTIKLVYEGGRAAVSILSSNPKTLELLNQKAAEIASILEEKTGQQTIIYTQPSEQQDGQDLNRNPDGHGREENEETRHKNREDNQHQTESFAQQLRLGLV